MILLTVYQDVILAVFMISPYFIAKAVQNISRCTVNLSSIGAVSKVETQSSTSYMLRRSKRCKSSAH